LSFLPRPVVILGAARTPIGAVGGALAPLQATDLAALAIQGAIAGAGIGPELVQYTCMGWVIQDPRATNMAKIAAERAGVPQTAAATTYQENCASGAAAVHALARRIALGEVELGVAGGAESMSNVPRYLYQGRTAPRLYGDLTLEDGLMGTLMEREVPEGTELMGLMTERLVERYGVSRQVQDEIAHRSHHRAIAAWEGGFFDDYVLPVEIPRRRKPPVKVERDEGPRKLELEWFTRPRPYFKPDGGTVTAQNSSSINDAAAALVLASASKARELGQEPLASLEAFYNLGVERLYMGEGAFKVLPPLLERAGRDFEEVDFFEINEAFAAVLGAAFADLPQLKADRVNAWGSGISLGHPVGCTGARQLADMVHQLQRRGAQLGVTSRCVGGGIGSGELLRRWTGW